MGIINRFLLFFYGLAIGVLSLGIAAACLGLLPEHNWINELRFASRQQETLTVAAVFAAVSFYFVCYSYFFGTSQAAPDPKEIIVVKGRTGDVRVAVDAVRNLAEREAGSVASVRDVKVRVQPLSKTEGNPLKLDVRLVLLSGANVPQVSDQVIGNIKGGLRQAMDFPDVPVSVTVEGISNAPRGDGKRVV